MMTREEAIKVLEMFLYKDCSLARMKSTAWDDSDVWEAVHKAAAALEEQQAGVIHGAWIRHTDIKNIYGAYCIECSECGEKYLVQNIEDERYCRCCGARMDKDESDQT